MMHVAVDAHNLATDWRGIGRYVRALLARFAARDDVTLTLLVNDWWPARTHATLAAVVGSERFTLARRVPRAADVVWHPWNGTFFASSRPAVVTFHDAVPFRWPNADPRKRANEQAPFVRSAQTARRFLANSHFTAREIAEVLHVEPERIDTALLGIEPVFFADTAARETRAKPYLLYVGATEPRKNVDTVIDAWTRAFPARDVDLVLAGSPPLDLRGATFVGALERDALIGLYRGARGVAVPSLYEGFGLPVLEAMACGAPVLAARATALPEAGGAAAAYVDDPGDPGAWRDALLAMDAGAERRMALALAGPSHAAAFTWDACAERTLTILRGAALPLASKT